MGQRFFIYIFLAVLLALPLDAKQKVKIEPSRAWGLTEPLGQHTEATIDTLFEDYHRIAVGNMVSPAWATTGNYGAPGQDQVFFNRAETSQFFFEDCLAPWLHNISDQLFYNTRIPMTLLGHTTGGDKYSNQDRTKALFSGNVNSRLQVGAGIDYIYSKGSYDNQADKNFAWQGFGSYMGDRYELQAFFNHYSYTTKESGGITDDRFITDPAEVQGGVTRVDNKSILTLLNSAQNSLNGSQFYMNHRYKVGFYRYQRDSITDTIVSKTYVPVTSFIWTMDYKNVRHHYIDEGGLEDSTFYAHTHLKLGGTDEGTRYWRLRNTVGVALLEGFNRWAKAGLSIYGTHEVRHFKQVVDTITGSGIELPEGLEALTTSIPATKTQHLAWVGGELTKQQGALLRYRATAQFGIVGDAAGDIDISGDLTTRFKLLGDSVALRAYGYIHNLEVPYLLQNFVSNHFAWQNSFSKQKRVRLGGELNVARTGTGLNVGYETLKDYVYFGPEALPLQHGSPVHVLSATLTQNFHFKAFHFDNTLVYQTTSNSDVLPLPKLAVTSDLYVKFLIAKVLHVQLGVDGNWYSKYHAPNYAPATMTFYRQDESKCGNFLWMNAYANFKLKRARFFVTYTHANGKIFGGDNYFAIPHYPLNPRRFQIGVSVDFAN